MELTDIQPMEKWIALEKKIIEKCDARILKVGVPIFAKGEFVGPAARLTPL